MTEFVSADFQIRRARRKPLEVEYVLATTDNLAEIVDWIKGHGHHATLGNGQLIIQTLEGPFTVRPGHPVVRGTAGEFYPMDPNIFRRTMDESS